MISAFVSLPHQTATYESQQEMEYSPPYQDERESETQTLMSGPQTTAATNRNTSTSAAPTERSSAEDGAESTVESTVFDREADSVDSPEDGAAPEDDRNTP